MATDSRRRRRRDETSPAPEAPGLIPAERGVRQHTDGGEAGGLLLTVAVLGDASDAAASALAARIGAPVVREEEAADADVLLARRGGRLVLLQARRPGIGPVMADIGAAYRARASGAGDPLRRAVGRSRGLAVDATAGLGRDTAALLRLGFDVVAVEQHPVIFELLADAARAAASAPSFPSQRLRLVRADARDFLRAGSEQPAVVCLDPMFPPRRKAAAVKKELALFQTLVGPNGDGAALLGAARAAATERVIVKRPLHAPPLADRPSFSAAGARVRWDVYLAAPGAR
jgi:16S rRNA (guanine1516-N2)-methyltransferase